MLTQTRTETMQNPGKDVPYLCRLEKMPSALVFIMGAHRSGTSLLYHLLANTNRFNYISAYDIVKYDELLFNHVMGMEKQVKQALDRQITAQRGDRLIDGIPVGADLPEEYRFILFKEKINPLLQGKTVLFSPNLVPESLERFVEMCQKKQWISAENRPLLLKNPNDFYQNFLAIHALFPDAKFVFIHRHPLHVFNSNMIAWPLALQTKSDYLGLLDPDYERLFRSSPVERILRLAFLRSGLGRRRILSGLVEGFAYYFSNISQLPSTSYVSIRYEDLCRNPGSALTEISQFLGVELRTDLPQQPVKPRALPVSSKVFACYEKKLNALKPYLSHLGYPLIPEMALSKL
ncbi:MAG TPA: sulfotransferase [Xanthomonadaceae bacterium]|nr:sulfotransferase [Xanthomonadaceae bacterium]